MISYKRFCKAIYFLLRDSAGSDIPWLATFLFTALLFVLVFYSIDAISFLVLKTPYIFERGLMFIVTLVFIVFNYFAVFKDETFLKDNTPALNPMIAVMIVILIFSISIVLILYAGPRNISYE